MKWYEKLTVVLFITWAVFKPLYDSGWPAKLTLIAASALMMGVIAGIVLAQPKQK